MNHTLCLWYQFVHDIMNHKKVLCFLDNVNGKLDPKWIAAETVYVVYPNIRNGEDAPREEVWDEKFDLQAGSSGIC